MNQEERSQRSRAQVLDAALTLFSRQGYRATSIRDIADAAGVSTGNVYHHFKDKETIFRELLEQYWAAIEGSEMPYLKVLATTPFPDNIEVLGAAARDMVMQYRRHVALIYVDVVEFEGSHIRKFYADMATRFARFAEVHPEAFAQSHHKLRPGLSPGAAMMLVTRFFMNYYSVEVLFGVPNHFGKGDQEALREIADVLRYGMVAQ